MSDWYVSSVAYAAVPQWAPNTAYTLGQFVRALATPAQPYSHYVHRCTTAGTSGATEPSWVTGNNATTTSGTATFTNVTGQSGYGWAVAAGNLYTLSNAGFARASIGDRVFLSSDHSETFPNAVTYGFGAAGFGLIQIISVNRVPGNIPPLASDIQPGAAITVNTGTFVFEANCMVYWQGVMFTYGGTALLFNNGGDKTSHFKNCAFVLAATSAWRVATNNPVKVILDNTTFQFGHIGQGFGNSGYAFEITWLNTLSAIQGAIIPTTLFTATLGGLLLVTCRGVDFSAVNTTLMASGTTGGIRMLLDSCRIASGVTRYGAPTTGSPGGDEIELVNCYDGANVINERHTAAGDLTVDRVTSMSGGAVDDNGPYSLKLVSGTRSDISNCPLHSFQLDTENASAGALRTATVEVITYGSLNNNDIRLLLQYMGTAGSPLASFVDSLPTLLTTAAALPTSLVTWNNPPPSIIPVWNAADSDDMTISGGGLIATGSAQGGVRCVNSITAGKFYWEYTLNTFASGNSGVGVASPTAVLPTFGANALQASLVYPNGNIWINGGNTGSSLGIRASGNVIGVAVDLTAGLIWFRVSPSGNWNNSGTANPVTGSGGLNISVLGSTLFPAFAAGASPDGVTANFGGTAYNGAAPSGFVNIVTVSATKQRLQVPFTPQAAGRVRSLVRLGKTLTTVWVNPQITIATVTADPFFSNVKLLMGFNDVNGSTGSPGLTDESPAAHGNANASGGTGTISTAQAKFGVSSFNPGSAGALYADSADWRLSSANSDQFTIDVAVRFNTVAANKVILAQYTIDSTYSWTLQTDGSNHLKFEFSPDGTFAAAVAIVGPVLSANIWYQIAVDKDALGKMRLYVGGVMVASATPANSSFFDSSVNLGIGTTAGGVGVADGYIDELRITKGVARYAMDSGYVVATAAFPRA